MSHRLTTNGLPRGCNSKKKGGTQARHLVFIPVEGLADLILRLGTDNQIAAQLDSDRVLSAPTRAVTSSIPPGYEWKTARFLRFLAHNDLSDIHGSHRD